MEFEGLTWKALLSNETLIVTLFAWFVTALTKVIISVFNDKKLVIVRLLGTGGMPSTHTASVVGLATILAILYGLDHPYFAISLALAIVVTYDATNLRNEAGKHAEAINILVEELTQGGKITIEKWKKMSELLGHTYFEVAVGGAMGIILAFLGHSLWVAHIGVLPPL